MKRPAAPGLRTLAVLAALLALALLIWFAGPLLTFAGRAPFITVPGRAWAIGLLAGVTLLALLVRRLFAARREARLLAALARESEASAGDVAAAEERAVLREKMDQAVATLRSRSGTRARDGRFVYQLPWYVIIGPPGAGKTTLLANSGLGFPLEETHGKQSIKGVGGTRDCDWWFTDNAVLLDTAGRYATQDSDGEVDSAAWNAFLALLKQTRPRRPLNGVLVAIGVNDIVGRDDETIEREAQRLRRRIDELQRELGIAPPVYLLLTKCDLLAGFDAFFADTGEAAREQVWGFTLPAPGESRQTTLSAELELLVETLRGRTLARLHEERSTERREFIYAFPLQFTALRKGVELFAERLGAQSRLVDDLLLRGVYFTSATQTGDALDQVIARVSEGAGLPARPPAATAGAGRSYFIRRLLEEVVFPESGLAGTDPRTERRLSRLQLGLSGVILLGLTALLGVWTVGWIDERTRLERVESRAAELDRALDALSPDDLDLVATTRALDLARSLDDAYDGEGSAVEKRSSLTVPLLGSVSRRPTVARFADEKYHELLLDTLLPRLLTRIEQRMQAESNDDDFLFEALKTYLMIGTPERFEPATVGGWFVFDTVANLPRDTPGATRASLERHIGTLFESAPSRLPRPLDDSLIARSRELVARVPLEQRAYGRVRGGVRGELEYSLPLSAISAELPRLFTLEDGSSLDTAIPRLFTVEGYRDVLLPAVGDIAERLTDESWVLGDAYADSAAGVDGAALDAAVRRRYEDDYIAAWQTLLDTLRLRPIDGLDGAARTIALLGAGDSPLAALLLEAAHQTAPQAAIAAAAAIEADAGGDDADADAAAGARSRAEELADLLGQRDEAAALADSREIPPDRVAEHFTDLHTLVSPDGSGSSPLDQVLGELTALNAQLLAMANSPAAAGDPTLARELAVGLQTLGFRSGRAAEPLASLVGELSDDIRDAAGSGLCRELDSAWQNDVLAFWRRAVRGRYPIYRSALSDVALADFAAFFGPTGRLQRFVDTRLASLVTRTPGQWTWSGGASSCLSEETLRQLALADEIRDTFFAGGGPTVSFTFDLIPGELAVAADITLLQLQIGASRVDYFHGPIAGTTSFTWPDSGGALQASLRVEPVVPGGSSGINAGGPWAILRLLDQGARTRRNAGLTVAWSFSGRAVSLGFATSSFNPLDSRALRAFRAPEAL